MTEKYIEVGGNLYEITITTQEIYGIFNIYEPILKYKVIAFVGNDINIYLTEIDHSVETAILNLCYKIEEMFP